MIKWIGILAVISVIAGAALKITEGIKSSKPPKPPVSEVEVHVYLTNAPIIPVTAPKPGGTNGETVTYMTNGNVVVEEAGYWFGGQWRPLMTRYNHAR